MAKRGKTPIFADTQGKVDALKIVEKGKGRNISYYHRNQLKDMGLIEPEDGKRRRGISRGRRPQMFKLTGRGRQLLGLSKAWEARRKMKESQATA